MLTEYGTVLFMIHDSLMQYAVRFGIPCSRFKLVVRLKNILDSVTRDTSFQAVRELLRKEVRSNG